MQQDVSTTPIYQGAPAIAADEVKRKVQTMAVGQVWDIAFSTPSLKEGRAFKMVVKTVAGLDRPDTAKATVDVSVAPDGPVIYTGTDFPFTDADLQVHYLATRVDIAGGDRWTNVLYSTSGGAMAFHPFEALSYGTILDGARGDPAKIDVAVERSRYIMCVEIGMDVHKVDLLVPLHGDRAENDRERRGLIHVFLGCIRNSACLANWRSAENLDSFDRILTSLGQFKILRCVGPKPKGSNGAIHPAIERYWQKVGTSLPSVRGKLPEIIAACISSGSSGAGNGSTK